MTNNNKIKGKIILRGKIKCLSPIHVGSGRGIHSDMDIIRNAEGKPVIPATGFVGVLRQMIKQQMTDEVKALQDFKDFWGYAENDDGMQSALCCSDLTCVNDNKEGPPEIVIRDGIRIDNKTGIVEPGGKYDFEVLERGKLFEIKMEFTYRKDNEAFVRKTARTIFELLADERVHVGAKTNNGFGRIGLVKDSAKFYLFDFSSEKSGFQKARHSPKMDVFSWLTQNFSEQNSIQVQDIGEPFPVKSKRFSITATLRLKNSFIVRSYSNEPKMSDASQLMSCEDWVIPGSSLKGAIRARAERIVNTLGLIKDGDDKIINDLFGKVDDKNRSKDAKKGRIRVQEITLSPDAFPAEQQTRIKIDRFTGGVMEGSLFDSMPIFVPEEDKTMKLNIEINDYKEREAGLLLLVLKDLWSGDLAVGGEKNIGRGIFQGVRAEIVWQGEQEEKIVLENDLTVLTQNEKARLQHCVDELVGEQN